MNAQAAGLQALAQNAEERFESSFRFSSPFVLVTGGKGGIGKTSITANLALALAGMGCRTLAADLDLGLANLDVLLRIFPKYHLGTVARGEKTARECIVRTPGNVDVIAAPSGIESMAALGERERTRILAGLASLSASYDLVLADSAAGIAPDVLAFGAVADRVLLVTTPEPSALTDAYALFKLLSQRRPNVQAGLVVNAAADLAEADSASKKLRLVAQRYLGNAPIDLGWIPRDAAVTRASREQRPFVSASPEALASASLRLLARRLREWVAVS